MIRASGKLSGLATVLVTLLAGCAQLRLPAIDPSGERIFLPAPAGTTLTPPRGLFPRPAYQAPDRPPPCAPTTTPAARPAPLPASGHRATGHRATGHRATGQRATGQRATVPGRILMSPQQMVAPVGSEVLVVAGFCSARNHYVTRLPVQWTVDPDGVGQILDISDDCSLLGPYWPGSKARQLSERFAVTPTAVRARRITRGTASLSDDLTLQRGQCYVTVTSATAGTTRLTAMAPDGGDWTRRRQTSVIQWVDAQWQLPGTAIATAGQPHELVTTLTRPSDGLPLRDWIVRYEVAPGSTAAFGGGQSSIDVVTDASGRAVAQLMPQSNSSVAATVDIQIFRPQTAASGVPVGRGRTSVTWSAPGLALRVTGPASAAVGGAARYRIEVSNTGTLTTQNVTVQSTLPDGLSIVSSLPTAEQFGERQQWRLGSLPSGATRVIEFEARGERAAVLDVPFVATADAGLQAAQSVTTEFVEPALVLNVTGPETAQVGDQVQYRIDVTNRSSRDLAAVNLISSFTVGLEHLQGQASPIRRSLGALAAGATESVAVTLVARAPGQHQHVVEVEAGSSQSARVVKAIELTPAPRPPAQPPANAPPANAPPVTAPPADPPNTQRPDLNVRFSATPESRLDETPTVTAEITNRGAAAATNLKIAITYDAVFEPLQASDGYDPQRIFDQREAVWTLAELLPGKSVRRRITLQGKRQAEAARNTLRVTADGGFEQTDQTTMRINAAAAPPANNPPNNPPANNPPNNPPANNPPASLTIDVSDLADSITLNGKTTYLITIENTTNASVEDVVVKIILPDEMKPTSLKGGPVGPQPQVGNQGQSFEMKPIKEIRPGEKLEPFRLEAEPVKAGRHTLRVEVRHRGRDMPLVAEEDTDVFPE